MQSSHKSPISQLNLEQSQLIQQYPYRQQTQFAYPVPKIDHAFIIQNYRRLRIQQRDQLAKLRMPQELKKKIFGFKGDQDLSYQKQKLVIFNHPFRGKTVMTEDEVNKELQRERKNAQMFEAKVARGQNVPQNILNEMGLDQEQLQIKRAKIVNQQQAQQNFPRKPRLTSNQPQKRLAEKINKQQQEKLKGNVIFLHKGQNDRQITQNQRTQKMRKLIEEKQRKSGRNSMGVDYGKPSQSEYKEKQKPMMKKRNQFNDMPIIGEQPKVVRDIKFEEEKTYNSKDKNQGRFSKKEQNMGTLKGYYRPFGNQSQIRQFTKKPYRKSQQQHYQNFGSGQAFIKKNHYNQQQYNKFQINQNKQIDQISAIQSNVQDDELSNNSQSLNKALFLQ